MAKQQENNQEPSIEEILDSIRQIISDDDEEAAPQAPAPTPPPEDDIIELTQKVPEREPIQVDMKEPDEPAPPGPEPEPEPEPEPAPPPPPPPPKAAAPAPKPEPKPEPKPAVAQNDVLTDDVSSILTKNAEESVMGAFTELTKNTNIAKADGVTVEDVVREELRPMLKQWLDKHLPSMVERLLQKEMERISKRVLGDDA